MKDSFSKLHPIVSLIYFLFAIILTMFTVNPICLLLSILCALLFSIQINGASSVGTLMKYMIFTSAVLIVINPVFNHEGATVLEYFPWGNPLTLESVLYGAAAAALLISAVLWFSCFNRVIGSDKIIYLFGRISPSFSLLISMTLRFIPRFIVQLKKVRNTRKCLTVQAGGSSKVSAVKNAVKIFSIMLTWALENSIDTADSMKSRGYGLKGRTSYSAYRFTRRDIVFLIITVLIGASVSALMLTGAAKFRYFPYLYSSPTDVPSILLYILYAALMSLPIIINTGDKIRWKHIISAI